MQNRTGEGQFIEDLRDKMLERVQEGTPQISRGEVEKIAASHQINEIRASQIFRSLEGELWRGTLIKADHPVPRNWVGVNDLEVLYW